MGLRSRNKISGPFGPIRMDLAYKLNPTSEDLGAIPGLRDKQPWARWTLYLSIGEAFKEELLEFSWKDISINMLNCMNKRQIKVMILLFTVIASFGVGCANYGAFQGFTSDGLYISPSSIQE